MVCPEIQQVGRINDASCDVQIHCYASLMQRNIKTICMWSSLCLLHKVSAGHVQLKGNGKEAVSSIQILP